MIGRYLVSVLLDDGLFFCTPEGQRVENVQRVVAAGAANDSDLPRQVDGQLDDALGAAQRLLVGNQRV